MTPDTQDLGESQVAAGWAVFEPSFFGTADEEDARRYARAEIAARQSGLGMWTRSSPPLDLTGLEAQIKRLADQGLNDPDNMESTLLRWQPLAAALLMGLGGLFLLIFAILQGRTVHDAVRR